MQLFYIDRIQQKFWQSASAKTFALSKLVLPATILNLPKNIVKKVNKIFYRFLWRSTEKVKRVKVIQQIEYGGLRMVDIQAFFDSLLANWVNRI